jgi:two-component system chemotaxis response regulator CheB
MSELRQPDANAPRSALGEQIRVIVVDDSSLFRSLLTKEIEKDVRFKVVGSCGDGREAVDLVRKLDPDVVTLDVEMPVMGGIEALRTIVSQSTSSVVMLSALTESGAAVTLEALEIGAIDFIPKDGVRGSIHQKLEVAASVRRRARRLKVRGASPLANLPNRRLLRVASVRRDIRVGVIGSSTGGPTALATVIKALPGSFSVPLVVAQHMPANFTEALAKRLDDECSLSVVHAHDGQILKPSTVYIAPGGSTIRITPSSLCITYGEAGTYRPSVDVLASSAAEAFRGHVLGVMLTGMGSDGAIGFKAIHDLGGHTIAQDQASCIVYGMPRAVCECGAAEEVLPLNEIGARMVELLDLRI